MLSVEDNLWKKFVRYAVKITMCQIFFLPDCNRNNDDMSYQSLPKIPITFFTPIFFQSETRHIVSHYSSLMETVNSFQNP